MATLIPDNEAQAGDVVLNFCDPEFAHDSDLLDQQRAADHLIRLLAYALYARRVFVPGRYLLAAGPFFKAVRLAPELLQEGILVPDLRVGVPTFRDLVAVRGLDSEAAKRADFVDLNASHVSVFDDRGQSERFHQRLMTDLQPNGALSTLVAPDKYPCLTKISEAFRDHPGSREGFVKVATDLAPELRATWSTWAAIRYYTTPMEFDAVRVRDLPHSAARTLARANSLSLLHFEDPTAGHGLPEPMAQVAQRMALSLPNVDAAKDARLLVEAVLATRQEVPEAREKLTSLISGAQAEGIAGALNQALLESLLKERVLKDLSPRVRDQVLKGAKQAGPMTLVGLVLGALLGPAAAAIDFVRGVIAPVSEANAQKAAAPWRMSYEHLAHHLDEPKV